MLQECMTLLVGWGLSEFEVVTAFKLLLASVFGGLIGLEREIKGRPAGMKTFSLVCIGSALVMITNEYISVNLSLNGDSARMAAQVISGIGFLGAGTIMVTRQNQVRGLTTAAALWVTAALGIAIGTGFYFGSVAGIIVINATSFAYRFVDRKIVEYSRIMKIYVEGTDEEFMLRLLEYFNQNNIRILSVHRRPETVWYKEDTCAMIEMDFGKRQGHQGVIEEIRNMEGLRYIEEI